MIKLIQEFNQLNEIQKVNFLSLIEESFLLLEGIKSAKEKYLDKIGEDKFNELIEVDSSRNKKYLDWICKEYLDGADIGRLRDDIKLFDEKCNKNLIKNKDIYSYDNINKLENILNQSPDISNRKKKEEIKKNPNKEEIEILPDVKVLRNDDEYFIAEIHSWEDAKFYGKGTKWCISERDNDRYWKEHYEDDGDRFIYVRDFKYPDLGMNSNINYKLMIQIPFVYINKNDKIDYSKQICNIWDAKDKKHNSNIQEISDRFRLNSKDISNVIKIDFNTKEGIKEWLDAIGIRNYTINDDLTVDVDGNVDLDYKNLSEISVQFGIINGYFDCLHNNLESLEGAPNEVNGDFYCNDNKLKSLKGAPRLLEGNFICFKNELKSLEGAPKIVKGNFNCSHNELKSLEGAPKIVYGDFNCSYNPNLESLKGSPQKVGGTFDCSYNPNLESLKGSPRKAKNFDCSSDSLKSLEGAPKIVYGDFNCSYNPKLKSLEGVPKEVKDFYCIYNPKLSKEYLDNFDFSFVKGEVIL